MTGRPTSTYVQNPPYFRGMGAKPGQITNIEGAKVLAILGDMITTDHISPAGSFKDSTPAGPYLADAGARRASSIPTVRGAATTR